MKQEVKNWYYSQASALSDFTANLIKEGYIVDSITITSSVCFNGVNETSMAARSAILIVKK